MERTISIRSALVAAACLVGPLVCSSGVTAPAADGSLFHLHTSTGESFSRGRLPADTLLVIYFGYSTCWRSCPMALNNIASAIDSLGPQATRIQPLFVDMDPAKTTRAQLVKYMNAFGPRFVGLFGTPRQVQIAASSFGVTVQKQQFSADPLDYAMTHTSPIILWDLAHGEPTTLPATSEPSEIVAALEKST